MFIPVPEGHVRYTYRQARVELFVLGVLFCPILLLLPTVLALSSVTFDSFPFGNDCSA